jgi:hypothetical protein
MKTVPTIVPIDGKAALDDMELGLDWAHWLLRSVRQRCGGILLQVHEEAAEFEQEWHALVTKRFHTGLGAALVKSWEAAEARSFEALASAEEGWVRLLTGSATARSETAGHLLLSATRGAHHAGVLQTVQEAVQEGRLTGHIGLVWPVVASVFQLPASTMLLEYLRLEFQCGSRQLVEVTPFQQDARLTDAVRWVLRLFRHPPRVVSARARDFNGYGSVWRNSNL